MDISGVTNTLGELALRFDFNGPLPFPEDFAVKRYLRKYEAPDESRVDELKAEAWQQFIDFDSSLPSKLVRPHQAWYRAREFIHKVISQFRMGDLSITNGSEFTPNHGLSSIEQKLCRSRWETTRGNIDLFFDAVRNNRSLAYSLRSRFKRHVRKAGLCPRGAEKYLWEHYRHLPRKDRVTAVLRAKLESVVTYVEGSRFSTVRKNNEKRRPINVETLPNMLTQRMIGIGVRNLLRGLGLDLDTAAAMHAKLVASPDVATLDLKNASDSVTLALVRFLFPKWFVRLLEDARSPFIYGPDHCYYDLKKVSSMGNGFTFELMSLILFALGRTLDEKFSVFGDDIIIRKDKARACIDALESVGFVVNEEKSFIDGPFRESCGANFHDEHGYIESYDLEYPTTIMEAASLYNKVKRLSQRYPSFVKLERTLLRAIPLALRGPAEQPARAVGPVVDGLPTHFATGGKRQVTMPRAFLAVKAKAAEFLHWDISERDVFVGLKFVPEVKTARKQNLKMRYHYGKYFMYLHGGRITDDVIKDTGSWVTHLLIGTAKSNTSWRSFAEPLTG